MAHDSIKTVNFGSSKGSLTTIGYRLYATDGALSGSRITAGVGEILVSAGIYSASVHFASHFEGSILWDTGESSPTYASEDYSPVLQLVSESIDHTKHMTAGRWKLDSSTKQMIFYKDDNSTEIARFDLTDENGDGSVSSVFERTKA
tara:strand:+ start:2075 stop:2515 length:441 start_codon:yes stop_codon:yes gene_type:complete